MMFNSKIIFAALFSVVAAIQVSVQDNEDAVVVPTPPVTQMTPVDQVAWCNGAQWTTVHNKVYGHHATKLIQRNLNNIFPKLSGDFELVADATRYLAQGAAGAGYLVTVTQNGQTFEKVIKLGLNKKSPVEFEAEHENNAAIQEGLETALKNGVITQEEKDRTEEHIQVTKHFLDAQTNMPCLVSEYLGSDLFEMNEKSANMAWDERVNMAYEASKQFVGALAVLHKLTFTINGKTVPFVHRDLKPENVCVKKVNGAWKLFIFDFGHASGIREAKEDGTAMFESPEYYQAFNQRRSYKADKFNDMWAAGLVIGALLCNPHTMEIPDFFPSIDRVYKHSRHFNKKAFTKHIVKYFAKHTGVAAVNLDTINMREVIAKDAADLSTDEKVSVVRNLIMDLMEFNKTDRLTGAEAFSKYFEGEAAAKPTKSIFKIVKNGIRNLSNTKQAHSLTNVVGSFVAAN
jgi:serine/threonine protein kinase